MKAIQLSRFSTKFKRPLLTKSTQLMTNAFRFHNHLASSANYNQLTDSHVEMFRSILGQTAVKTEDLDEFNYDWLKLHKGTCHKPPNFLDLESERIETLV
jgi:hypothetical protein